MKIFYLFLVFGLLISTLSYAWECDYGEAKAWIKLPNETEWREAIVRGVTLKVHEPFKVKVWIKTKVDVYVVGIGLSSPGVTKVFEKLSGPSLIGDEILKYDVPANWSKTYEWTVRPTGKWTEGWAPLNFGVVFMKTQDDYKNIGKTVIHAYISPEEWKENEKEKGSEENVNKNEQIGNEEGNLTASGSRGSNLVLWIVLFIIIVILLIVILKFKIIH